MRTAATSSSARRGRDRRRPPTFRSCRATCNKQHACCNKQNHAPCATCNMRHATHTVQRTPCNAHRATRNAHRCSHYCGAAEGPLLRSYTRTAWHGTPPGVVPRPAWYPTPHGVARYPTVRGTPVRPTVLRAKRGQARPGGRGCRTHVEDWPAARRRVPKSKMSCGQLVQFDARTQS